MAKRKVSAKVLANLKKGRLKRLKNLKNTSKKSSSKTLKVKVKMAKKRRTYAKSKPKSSGMFANVSGIAGAVCYGAVRERISDYIANTQIGRQLPATQFTDEAVMLAVNFGARKLGLGKNKLGNSVLKAQKTVELARIGQGISDMISAKSNVSAVSNNMVVIS